MSKTPRYLPVWARRLFHQREPGGTFRTGRDLGWDGPAAMLEISDHFQFAKLKATVEELDRVHVADGYLRKIYKHLAYAAYERGDFDLIDRADAECRRLAQEIVTTVEGLRAKALARGYLDDLEV